MPTKMKTHEIDRLLLGNHTPGEVEAVRHQLWELVEKEIDNLTEVQTGTVPVTDPNLGLKKEYHNRALIKVKTHLQKLIEGG